MELQITKQQEKFCYEYMKNFDGTKAAIRAGYSPKGAGYIAYNTLAKPHVRKFLDSLLNKKAEMFQTAVDKIISECKTIAFSTVDGDIIKTADKLKALEMLGKYLGLFSEQSREPFPEPIVHVYFEDKTEGK